MPKAFVLLLQCPDQKGIVAKVSNFILRHNGNILCADQYSSDPRKGHFFMRVEFRSEASKEALSKGFLSIAARLKAEVALFDKAISARMGILVSGSDHCLVDLLYRWKIGELPAKIPLVISNHLCHRKIASQYGIPFHYLPANKGDRKESEIHKLVKDSTDFLVLARYMLVLSRGFLEGYGKDVINIHHGFLPSFKGADPYRQAFEKGVKVIGATAHFVDERLDDGPIIAQAVTQVSHKDDLAALKRKGRSLESAALAEAVHSYLDHRVIRYRNKTIVF